MSRVSLPLLGGGGAQTSPKNPCGEVGHKSRALDSLYGSIRGHHDATHLHHKASEMPAINLSLSLSHTHTHTQPLPLSINQSINLSLFLSSHPHTYNLYNTTNYRSYIYIYIHHMHTYTHTQLLLDQELLELTRVYLLTRRSPEPFHPRECWRETSEPSRPLQPCT